MFRQRSGYKMMFLALIAVLLMSLPLAAAAETTNGITSPKDGATVSGTVDVKGYASDPSFMKWQLDVLPGGDCECSHLPGDGRQAGRVQLHCGYDRLPERRACAAAAGSAGRQQLRRVRQQVHHRQRRGEAAAAPTAAAKDIVATAIGAGQFKTLVAAVQAAGLVEALQGKGPFTVFAPTDAAFAKLPAGTVEGLLKDPKALTNILLYHVVPGAVKAAAVKDGMTAKTLQASPVTFKVDGRQGDDQRRQHRCDRRDGLERRDPRNRLGDSAAGCGGRQGLHLPRCLTASRVRRTGRR